MRRPLSHLSFVIQDLITNISCKDWIAYAKTRKDLQDYLDKCDKMYDRSSASQKKITKVPSSVRKFDREEDWFMLP